MHLAAGADALDDLLPDVAALGEVEGLVLLGLLRQIALADVLAVARQAGGDAPEFERLRPYGRRAGRDQRVPEARSIRWRQPDLVAGLAARGADQRDADVQQRGVTKLERLERRR
jgi:hypothetical protein